MKHLTQNKALYAAGLIGAGVALFALTAVQQNYRLSADDPQIQLARDAAARLSRGEMPATVVGERVDASSSLAPFLTVYDAKLSVMANSGDFHGRALTPPAGVFDVAKSRGEYRTTWATAEGQREAMVLEHYQGPHGGGYVLAARNLSEIERREHTLNLMFLATLLGIVLVVAVFAILLP